MINYAIKVFLLALQHGGEDILLTLLVHNYSLQTLRCIIHYYQVSTYVIKNRKKTSMICKIVYICKKKNTTFVNICFSVLFHFLFVLAINCSEKSQAEKTYVNEMHILLAKL